MEPLAFVPLAPHTTLGVGGPARYFWEVSSEDELVAALDWARQRKMPLKVLGGGSNVVVADSGFDGLVIKMALLGIRKHGSHGQEVEVAAGESWHTFVLSQVERELQGIECLAGIPGLVGATPIQNVGAYGQEVCESIVEVVALDTERATFERFDHAALAFDYRDSFFKRNAPDRFIVTRVRFRLVARAAPKLAYAELTNAVAAWSEAHAGQRPSLRDTSQIVLGLRAAKSMLLEPETENSRSCGSFFVNPRVPRDTFEAIQQRYPERAVPHYPESDGRVKLPAAWLIEQAGLTKGTRRGNVGLSTKHSLALVCHAGAQARDVLCFAREIQQCVRERFGVELAPEPVLWGFDQGL